MVRIIPGTFKRLTAALISVTHLGMWHCFCLTDLARLGKGWLQRSHTVVDSFSWLILLTTINTHIFPPKSLLNSTGLYSGFSSVSLSAGPFHPPLYYLASVTCARTVFVFLLKWNKNAIFFNKAIKILQILIMPSSMLYLFVDKADLLSEATLCSSISSQW